MSIYNMSTKPRKTAAVPAADRKQQKKKAAAVSSPQQHTVAVSSRQPSAEVRAEAEGMMKLFSPDFFAKSYNTLANHNPELLEAMKIDSAHDLAGKCPLEKVFPPPHGKLFEMSNVCQHISKTCNEVNFSEVNFSETDTSSDNLWKEIESCGMPLVETNIVHGIDGKDTFKADITNQLDAGGRSAKYTINVKKLIGNLHETDDNKHRIVLKLDDKKLDKLFVFLFIQGDLKHDINALISSRIGGTITEVVNRVSGELQNYEYLLLIYINGSFAIQVTKVTANQASIETGGIPVRGGICDDKMPDKNYIVEREHHSDPTQEIKYALISMFKFLGDFITIYVAALLKYHVSDQQLINSIDGSLDANTRDKIKELFEKGVVILTVDHFCAYIASLFVDAFTSNKLGINDDGTAAATATAANAKSYRFLKCPNSKRIDSAEVSSLLCTLIEGQEGSDVTFSQTETSVTQKIPENVWTPLFNILSSRLDDNDTLSTKLTNLTRNIQRKIVEKISKELMEQLEIKKGLYDAFGTFRKRPITTRGDTKAMQQLLLKKVIVYKHLINTTNDDLMEEHVTRCNNLLTEIGKKLAEIMGNILNYVGLILNPRNKYYNNMSLLRNLLVELREFMEEFDLKNYTHDILNCFISSDNGISLIARLEKEKETLHTGREGERNLTEFLDTFQSLFSTIIYEESSKDQNRRKTLNGITNLQDEAPYVTVRGEYSSLRFSLCPTTESPGQGNVIESPVSFVPSSGSQFSTPRHQKITYRVVRNPNDSVDSPLSLSWWGSPKLSQYSHNSTNSTPSSQVKRNTHTSPGNMFSKGQLSEKVQIQRLKPKQLFSGGRVKYKKYKTYKRYKQMKRKKQRTQKRKKYYTQKIYK